jgi:asparagine synthase (glutamine-hydrolysing)
MTNNLTHMVSGNRTNISVSSEWTCINRDNAQVFVKGFAFWKDRLLNQIELAKFVSSRVSEITTPERADNFLLGLNGFFSIVVKTEDQVFAAVDRNRSYPLFYGKVSGCIYISDNAYWVLKTVGDKAFDDLSEAEFLLTGYVTGDSTLYPNIKQLQAGEYLSTRAVGQGSGLETKRYFRFFHLYDQGSKTKSFYLHQMDEVLSRIFYRLIEWANGRTLVVPLSGGFDSRLICLMLKKLAYKNVVALSYGLSGNKEADISKQVASSLGLTWIFVPYSHQMWRDLFYTEERKKYYRFADGLSSIPHLQDWPAVWELKRSGILPEDSVFVPGHTVTLYLEGRPIYNKPKTLVDAIFIKYYNLWSSNLFSTELLTHLRNKIWSLLEDLPRASPRWAIDAFESWEIQERQVKFIGNSVRVYEFFGYPWYLPLKDAELMQLWSEIPFEFRVNKKIYADFITQLHQDLTGVNTRYATSPFARVKKAVRSSPLGSFSQKIYREIMAVVKKKNEYHSNPMGWYGIMPEEKFKHLYSGMERFTSFCVLERIKPNVFDLD